MFAGKRIERIPDRLRAVSRLAAEQDCSLDNQTDPARQRPIAAAGLTTRQVFFRFSTRQSMLLVITLSVCFAVNRNNRSDDLLFIVFLIFNKYTMMLTCSVVVALAIGKMARSGDVLSPSGRRVQEGRDSGCSWGSRADTLSVRLRSISRLVREQLHSRGATVESDAASRGGADS